MLRKHWYKILMISISLVLVAAIVYRYLPKSSSLPILGEAAPFQLTNTDGKQVSLKDSDGKVRIVYFFFSTCPDVCTPTNYMLSRAAEQLKEKGLFGSKVVFHSITFDPKVDTMEKLKSYATMLGAANTEGWKFLRNDSEEDIKALASRYDVMILKDKDGNFGHTNILAIVDGKGNIRAKLNGTTAHYEDIVKEIELLVK